MESRTDLTEVLNYIDPAGCTYAEWLNVGMALKEEGYDCSVWEDWSRRESRYHKGECQKKWNTFRTYITKPQNAILLFTTIIPAILLVIVGYLIYKYPLTDERLDEINREIEARAKA